MLSCLQHSKTVKSDRIDLKNLGWLIQNILKWQEEKATISYREHDLRWHLR